jgi:hypothetical protein
VLFDLHVQRLLRSSQGRSGLALGVMLRHSKHAGKDLYALL